MRTLTALFGFALAFQAQTASACPEWLLKTIPQDAHLQCTEIESSDLGPLLGKGLANSSSELGFNFYCKDQNCSSLGVLLSDFQNKKLYDLSSNRTRNGLFVPTAKDPKQQETVLKYRLKTIFGAITHSEWIPISNGSLFPRLNSGRESLATPNMDQKGWNWSSHPQSVSDQKLKKLLEAVLRPDAIQLNRYCKLILKMYALADTAARQNPATPWLNEETKTCNEYLFL